MTEKQSVWAVISRQSLSIAIVLLAVVVIAIYLDYRNLHSVDSTVSTAAGGAKMPFLPKPPSLDGAGRSMPKIVENMGGGAPSGAPMLDGLVEGLKAKVKANPKDIGKRILLAQTYRELGKTEESLNTLKKLREEFPEHPRVKLVTASVLSQQEDEKDLKLALKLLSELSKQKDDTIKPYLVNMYQGDAYIRLKDHKEALQKWKQALATMPQSDNRYKVLQGRIESINQGKKNTTGAAGNS